MSIAIMNRLYARPKVRIKRPDTEKHLRALVFRSRIITDCLQSKRIATKVTFKRGFLSVQAQSFDTYYIILRCVAVERSQVRRSYRYRADHYKSRKHESLHRYPKSLYVFLCAVRWRRSQIAETFASVRVSAPCYRFAEYIGFFSIVKTELKLIQVQRQMFPANIVVRPDDSALEQRPKRINRLSMNLATYIFASTMAAALMPEFVTQLLIAVCFIGSNQFHPVRNNPANESIERRRIGSLDHFADHVALTGNRADDWLLAGRAFGVWADALAAMFVLFLSTNIRLINFYDAHQLTEIGVEHTGSQTHTHIPSRAIRAGSKQTMNLQRTDALFGGQHEQQSFEPRTQRQFGFLEDRPRLERKTIRRAIIFAAFLALPVPRTRRALINMIVLTARAFRASGPAAQEQIRPTRLLVWKHALEVGERHLSRKFRFVFFPILHDPYISKKQRGSQHQHTSLCKALPVRRAWQESDLLIRFAPVGEEALKPEIRQRIMQRLFEHRERHRRDIGSDPVKPLFVFRSPELKTFHVKRFPENLSSTAPFSTAFEKSDCHCTCLLNIGRRGQPTHLSQKQGPEVRSSDSSCASRPGSARARDPSADDAASV